jgi:hypothetical protein
VSDEEEFYKDYYKYFSGVGDINNIYDFKKKTEKRLKFGSQGAAIRYSAFDGNSLSINLNIKLSNDFIEKLDKRLNRVQKALEDIRNDLRRSEQI